MGLDIRYASKLRRVECSDGVDCDHLHVSPDDSFPGRAEPLTDGCYECAGASGHFRAGSYSGYNAWRDGLARLVCTGGAQGMWDSPATYAAAPFYELVNFSDCEGVIGPVIAKKLAADFAAHDATARREMGEYEYGKYREWQHAFDVAADNGAVVFG